MGKCRGQAGRNGMCVLQVHARLRPRHADKTSYRLPEASRHASHRTATASVSVNPSPAPGPCSASSLQRRKITSCDWRRCDTINNSTPRRASWLLLSRPCCAWRVASDVSYSSRCSSLWLTPLSLWLRQLSRLTRPNIEGSACKRLLHQTLLPACCPPPPHYMRLLKEEQHHGLTTASPLRRHTPNPDPQLHG
jgi:hypothetical protein